MKITTIKNAEYVTTIEDCEAGNILITQKFKGKTFDQVTVHKENKREYAKFFCPELFDQPVRSAEEFFKHTKSQLDGLWFQNEVENTLIIAMLNEFRKQPSESKPVEPVKSLSEWTNIENGLPICFQRGNWDGLKSEFHLVELSDGTYVMFVNFIRVF